MTGRGPTPRRGSRRAERDAPSRARRRFWRDGNTVDGIPVTTPVRTIIDIAPEVETAELDAAIEHCLDRRLFTMEEMAARLAESDMADRAGAHLVRAALDRRAG